MKKVLPLVSAERNHASLQSGEESSWKLKLSRWRRERCGEVVVVFELRPSFLGDVKLRELRSIAQHTVFYEFDRDANDGSCYTEKVLNCDEISNRIPSNSYIQISLIAHHQHHKRS